MPKDMSLNYLELPANDLAAIEKFYSGVFGWSFTAYGADYLAFNDGTTTGGFYKSKLSSNCANGAALLVIYAKDLEQVEQAVIAAGGTISTAIFSFPGGRRFHFNDPAGNELAVWSE